ncbi:DUF4381 domain-containing protein [Photobacterium sp. DNB22_13_2]
MSIEHSPPSTYILRELYDVAVPDSVSWMPQTIGWKILLVLLIVIAGYVCYRLLQRWWHNRYRAEAIAALNHLSIEDPQFEDTLFSILKIVLVYLDPTNAKLFSTSFLQQLDALSEGRCSFDDELSQKWIQSLVDPAASLDDEEREVLRQRALQWVKFHQGKPIKSASVRSLFAKSANDRKEQGENRHV